MPQDTDIDDRILVAEERAVVDVRRRDTGGLRVATRTTSGTEELRVALEDVSVEVERVPVGRFVTAAEPPRTEATPDGEVTVLPVYEERPVVETRLWLVEEVRILHRRRSREEVIPVELRRQVAEVEQLEPAEAVLDVHPAQE
jgi:stress response protein YsnF